MTDRSHRVGEHGGDDAYEHDRAVVARQLGRPTRGMRRVAHRCACGLPDVVETSPRLTDGTPFPTVFYLTCPTAASAIGRPVSSSRGRSLRSAGLAA